MIGQITPDAVVHVHDALVKPGGIRIPVGYLRLRRAAEVLAVIVLLPFVLPAVLLVALLIAVTSRGNVLYIQARPGRDGKVFSMYKFRTMHANSSTDLLAQENDQRITRAGKWLRKYRIDELPQLLNVLKGDMSIIGPRPVPHNFYQTYLDEVPGYNLRHLIRPGITGLAQVLQGYTRTLEEEQLKFRYDLYYISNISAEMDWAIIRTTVLNLLRGKK